MGTDLHHILGCERTGRPHNCNQHLFEHLSALRMHNMSIMNGMARRLSQLLPAAKQGRHLRNAVRSADPDDRDSSLAYRR
ncbi:hypothetical protein D3C73_1386570 [compost metagenome]